MYRYYLDNVVPVYLLETKEHYCGCECIYNDTASLIFRVDNYYILYSIS